METKIKCPKCGKEEILKSGKTGGKQQYQCKSCKRKFITEKNYSEEFKQKAIAIFYEGNSGRIMGINKSTVYNWIKKLDEKLQDVESVEETIAVQAKQAEVIEMDELFDYINEKKQSLRNNVGNKKTATNRRF